MGRVRARERRAGIRREGPAGRARAELGEHIARAGEDVARADEDVAREQHRERARDRQRESRRRRRKAANPGSYADVGDGSLSGADIAGEEGVNRRLVRRDVVGILACVESTLGRRRRPLPHKQAVIRTVWESPIIRKLLPPEAQKAPSEVHTQRGLFLACVNHCQR